MEVNLWLCAGLVLAGIVLNVIQKLYEAEQAGIVIGICSYLRSHPYGVTFMTLSALLLMAFWYFIGELTYVTAILTGVAASSAFDTLRVKAEAKLRSAP